MNFYVIDQNYFRIPALEISILNSASNESFVITDSALIEMTKNDHWETIMVQNLEIVSKYSNKIVISKAPSEILQEEIRTKKPIVDIVAKDLTFAFQSLLKKLNRKQHQEVFRELRAILPDAQKKVQQEQLNPSISREHLVRIGNNIKETLGPSLLKELRAERFPHKEMLLCVVHQAKVMLDGTLLDQNFTEVEKARFHYCDSFFFREVASIALASFKRLKEGNLENIGDKSVVNDSMDLRYIKIACSGLGILSKDNKVKEIYKDMKSIIQYYQTMK